MISYLRAQDITLIYDPDEHQRVSTHSAVPVTIDRSTPTAKEITQAESRGRAPAAAEGRARVTLQPAQIQQLMRNCVSEERTAPTCMPAITGELVLGGSQ